jgi:hypothetical protein
MPSPGRRRSLWVGMKGLAAAKIRWIAKDQYAC